MKTFKQLVEGVIQPNGTDKIKTEDLKGACWKGYEAIGMKKKNGKMVPNCVPVKEETLDEGKMAQLHADIEDHLGKHVANYKKMGGAEHLGNKTVEVAKKIAKLHNISHEAAQKHVNDYVDQNLKESDASWAASLEKKKEDRMTDKDKGTLGKIRDLMAKEKAKREFDLKMKKAQNSQRVAKALGEETINEAHVVHVSDGSKYDEEPHEQDVKHVNDGVKKHGGEFDGHSDKGAFFKFKSRSDAENFRRHVNASPKRTVSADHLDESVNEAIDKEHPIYKEYQALRKMPIKDLRNHIKQQHRIVDTSEFRTKEHAASHIINNKHGSKRVKAVFGEETELDEKYNHGPIDREAKVKVGHHAAVVAGSGVDSGKHGKVIGQSKTHIGDQWHIKTADGEVVKMYKNRVAKLKEETELDEGIVDKVRSSNYKRLAKRSFDKAYNAHQDALDSPKTPAERRSSRAEFNKHYDKGIARMKKSNTLTKEEVENIDEAYRLPSDSEISKVKAHVKANHPNKSLAQIAVHKQSKKIEYVVKDKEGKMTGHTLGEEVEQIDEISKQTLGNYIKRSSHDAALSARHGGSDPKELKNAIKRLKGIAKATNKLTKEESEQIDEISKDTLHSYIHKAFAQGNDLHYDLAHSRGDKATDAERKALQAKISKRNTGIIKAGKKLREDVSMLSFEDFLKEQKACKKEELHPNQKKLDVNKNGKLDSDDFVKLRAGKKKEVDEKYVSDAQRKAVWASKNEKGVKEEFNLEDFSIEEIEEFMMSEEYEQLDELSRKTLANYAQKAAHDVGNKMYSASGKRGLAAYHSNKGNEKTAAHFGKEGDKAHSKALTRLQGIKTAAKKLAKEEVELDEAMTPMQKLKDALDRHSEKAIAANKAGDHEAVKVHQGYMNKIKTKMGKLAKNEEIDLNEMENLCEISKQTLGSYVAKASHSAANKMYSAGYTDHMSHTERNKGNDALAQAHDRHAGKNYSKSLTRLQGIKRASEKLAKEEVEQIDELSKTTLGNYAKRAASQTLGLSAALGAMKTVDSAVDAQRKLRNRYQGTQKAITKLAKEDTEVITFKDLMQNISEAAIDDLKDRIAARKATQSAYDKDYKPAAKTNVQKVKGHSYGAGEEEGEDDEDTKKVAKPAEPAVKRGRGRPAGSKSGARR